MSLAFEKYYSVLDLKPSATEQEVRAAYRLLVKVWHPDRFENDEALKKVAEEKLKAINVAYEALTSRNSVDEHQTSADTTRKPQKQTDESITVAIYDKGVDFYNAGDFRGALIQFHQAAQRGHIDAQFWTGYIRYHYFSHGQMGWGAYWAETYNWLLKAAEQGHIEAQFTLGQCHMWGLGTSYSVSKAKKWYSLAAKQGHKEAKSRLGIFGYVKAFWG